MKTAAIGPTIVANTTAQVSTFIAHQPPRSVSSVIARVYRAALPVCVEMGDLHLLGNPLTTPAMAQKPCADKPDCQNHGRAEERRHAEAEMTEGIAVIDRPDGLTGKE